MRVGHGLSLHPVSLACRDRFHGSDFDHGRPQTAAPVCNSHVMGFHVFEVGQTLAVTERWHGLLWSAVPGRVIATTSDELAVWVPTGTIGTFATNRGMPATEGLSREQRKLLALRTRRATVAEAADSVDKLLVYRASRWARVDLGWESAKQRFLGWYVNFELPARTTPGSLTSKDLVLDLWVDPDGSWRWKDRDDYDAAIVEGILDPSIRGSIDAEVAQILRDLESRSGPFDSRWCAFHLDPTWPVPELPPAYAWGGSAWTLPPGRRLAK